MTGRRVVAGAWLIAVVATGGSLYYQYGMGLYPCELCWFQRIAMYPLVVILGHAVITRRRDVQGVVLALAIPGWIVSAYHSSLQTMPALSCTVGGCGRVQFRLLGLTIPNQALIAFTLVAGVIGLNWLASRRLA